MAYKDPQRKKEQNRKWYVAARKHNLAFKAWKKKYDHEYHKHYTNPHLTAERQRLYVAAYKQRNREIIREKDRAYKKKHYQRYRDQNKQYMAKHPEKRKQYAEKYRLDGRTKAAQMKSRYGITPLDFQELLDRQHNVCPVCKQDFTHRKRYIDHDHATGKVRGIVHMQCNTLMGLAKDDPKTLEGAARYLRKGAEK